MTHGSSNHICLASLASLPHMRPGLCSHRHLTDTTQAAGGQLLLDKTKGPTRNQPILCVTPSLPASCSSGVSVHPKMGTRKEETDFCARMEPHRPSLSPCAQLPTTAPPGVPASPVHMSLTPTWESSSLSLSKPSPACPTKRSASRSAVGIILGGRRGGTGSAAEGRRSCAGEQLPDHRVPPFLPRLPQLWPLPLPALETRRLPEGPTKGAERSGPFRLRRPVTGALPPQEGTPMLGKTKSPPSHRALLRDTPGRTATWLPRTHASPFHSAGNVPSPDSRGTGLCGHQGLGRGALREKRKRGMEKWKGQESEKGRRGTGKTAKNRI